jgi:hypothetical protein
MEPKPGVQKEQAQAKGLTNLDWIKTSPGAPHSILDFYYFK